MKPFNRMKPESPPLANTARRAVSRERARPEPRKTRHPRENRSGGRPATPNPRRPAAPADLPEMPGHVHPCPQAIDP